MKEYYHAVSLSGGKDSTAMLLLMIERDMPIDLVLTADTGMEFPEMYQHLAKVDDYLFRQCGLHITTLRHPKGFEWLMFDEPKQKKDAIELRLKNGAPPCGNGWPGMKVRWCTGQLKTHLINKKVNALKGKYHALHYVGVAADEKERCKGETYPLVEWGITEAQALQYCYAKGFDFGGLYRIYNRVSCWCCPFQRMDALRKLRHHHPELWAKLRAMDLRAIAQFVDTPQGKFKTDWTVEALERRFALEDAQLTIYDFLKNTEKPIAEEESLPVYRPPPNERSIMMREKKQEERYIRFTNLEKKADSTLFYTRAAIEQESTNYVGCLCGRLESDGSIEILWKSYQNRLWNQESIDDFDAVLNWLRQDFAPLKDLRTMAYFCGAHSRYAKLSCIICPTYGFQIGTEQYQYRLRCCLGMLTKEEPNFYLYSYRKETENEA
mgnify:FL=1